MKNCIWLASITSGIAEKKQKILWSFIWCLFLYEYLVYLVLIDAAEGR